MAIGDKCVVNSDCNNGTEFFSNELVCFNGKCREQLVSGLPYTPPSPPQPTTYYCCFEDVTNPGNCVSGGQCFPGTVPCNLLNNSISCTPSVTPTPTPTPTPTVITATPTPTPTPTSTPTVCEPGCSAYYCSPDGNELLCTYLNADCSATLNKKVQDCTYGCETQTTFPFGGVCKSPPGVTPTPTPTPRPTATPTPTPPPNRPSPTPTPTPAPWRNCITRQLTNTVIPSDYRQVPYDGGGVCWEPKSEVAFTPSLMSGLVYRYQRGSGIVPPAQIITVSNTSYGLTYRVTLQTNTNIFLSVDNESLKTGELAFNILPRSERKLAIILTPDLLAQLQDGTSTLFMNVSYESITG